MIHRTEFSWTAATTMADEDHAGITTISQQQQHWFADSRGESTIAGSQETTAPRHSVTERSSSGSSRPDQPEPCCIFNVSGGGMVPPPCSTYEDDLKRPAACASSLYASGMSSLSSSPLPPPRQSLRPDHHDPFVTTQCSAAAVLASRPQQQTVIAGTHHSTSQHAAAASGDPMSQTSIASDSTAPSPDTNLKTLIRLLSPPLPGILQNPTEPDHASPGAPERRASGTMTYHKKPIQGARIKTGEDEGEGRGGGVSARPLSIPLFRSDLGQPPHSASPDADASSSTRFSTDRQRGSVPDWARGCHEGPPAAGAHVRLPMGQHQETDGGRSSDADEQDDDEVGSLQDYSCTHANRGGRRSLAFQSPSSGTFLSRNGIGGLDAQETLRKLLDCIASISSSTTASSCVPETAAAAALASSLEPCRATDTPESSSGLHRPPPRPSLETTRCDKDGTPPPPRPQLFFPPHSTTTSWQEFFSPYGPQSGHCGGAATAPAAMMTDAEAVLANLLESLGDAAEGRIQPTPSPQQDQQQRGQTPWYDDQVAPPSAGGGGGRGGYAQQRTWRPPPTQEPWTDDRRFPTSSSWLPDSSSDRRAYGCPNYPSIPQYGYHQPGQPGDRASASHRPPPPYWQHDEASVVTREVSSILHATGSADDSAALTSESKIGRRVYTDDRDRMVYVSWIPKKARAYTAMDKRRMELDLKRRLREDLALTGLTKVLLFPPKGVHCKLIFDCRNSASMFMEIYGGDNRSPETEKWKGDLCRIYDIDMHDKFDKTIVKIEWSQK